MQILSAALSTVYQRFRNYWKNQPFTSQTHKLKWGPNSGHKVYTPPLFPHSFWSNWNRSSWIGLKQIQSGSTIFLAILYNFYEVRQIIFILSVDLLQRKWFVTLNCSFGKTIEEKGRSCLQMFSKFFCSFWHFLFYIQHFFFQH